MTSSFTSLGLSEARVSRLQTLGFEKPTEIQARAIPPLLEGRDVVGKSQTGTGKTAAFSLPMLERIDPELKAVQALVLTPTRELAVQVCRAISTFTTNRRLHTLAVYGGQAIDRQISRLRRGVQVVVGTPGRLLDLLDRGELKLHTIQWLVLDEADEMLNMGFIQDVEKILKQVPEERQTAFFSATMEPAIQRLVKKFLNSPVTVEIERAQATPTRIEQVAYMVPRGWRKAQALQPILELEDPEAALIFVRTRRAASELTSRLQAAGHSVDEYHGDLSQAQRERLITRFRQQQVRWVVATDIAARGLDVDHLTHVINYDLPDSVDSYVHRIGRTGRAGREGTAIALIRPMDRRKLRDIERHVRQSLPIQSIPSRAKIEARRIERLKEKVQEALAGERLASFLPIVSQLEEEYDAHAIAAAALQLAYDSTCPQVSSDYEEPPAYEEERPRRRNSRSRSGSFEYPRKRSAAERVARR